MQHSTSDLQLGTLLRSERIRLTALRPDDFSTIARWYQNPDFLRLFDARAAYPLPEGQLKEMIEGQQKSKEAFVFAIRQAVKARPAEGESLEDPIGGQLIGGQLIGGQLIGMAEIDDILWNDGVAWVSIGIGEPEHWNQGYGTEAMQLLMAFAFQELNLHRLQLTVFEYNRRAIALYEKMGFQHEGTFREFMQRDGKWYDMYLYGILRQEWKA